MNSSDARDTKKNDENVVIISGQRSLAEVCACHVLDAYGHFSRRRKPRKDPKTFGWPLDSTDSWQSRYFKSKRLHLLSLHSGAERLLLSGTSRRLCQNAHKTARPKT